MKYNELKIGDYFTVERENNANFYIKQEFCILDAHTKQKYKKYKGDTKVRKVEHENIY